MKETRKHPQTTDPKKYPKIPDIQILDLNVDTFDKETDTAADHADKEAVSSEKLTDRRSFSSNKHTAGHIALRLAPVVIIVAIAGIIGYRFFTYGDFISQEEIFKEDGNSSEFDIDSEFDTILPLLDEDGQILQADRDGEVNVLLLGNSPFSDDRDSADGLANMIADRTDANIINCSVSGSYMAARLPVFDAERFPMDAYTPYWLCALMCKDVIDSYYEDAAEALGDQLPPEAPEVFNTLSELDMNTIDVICFMYDGTDYLMGNEMYNDADATDITQFTGNLQASIELLQKNFPHIRIIVMSPTYAFGIDENGEYISSDIQTYGQHYLSTYFNKEFASCYDLGVTFVDNLYVTITEDNARQYLTDNIHLNTEGRKRVADRFIYALNYYSN